MKDPVNSPLTACEASRPYVAPKDRYGPSPKANPKFKKDSGRDQVTFFRELQVPAPLLMEPKATDLAWSGVLCCVYTRVSLWDEQSILAYKRSGIKLPTKAARLISSSNEDYPKLYAEKTFENLAMKAFNDICLLDTGARDCDQATACVEGHLSMLPLEQRRAFFTGAGGDNPLIGEGVHTTLEEKAVASGGGNGGERGRYLALGVAGGLFGAVLGVGVVFFFASRARRLRRGGHTRSPLGGSPRSAHLGGGGGDSASPAVLSVSKHSQSSSVGGRTK